MILSLPGKGTTNVAHWCVAQKTRPPARPTSTMGIVLTVPQINRLIQASMDVAQMLWSLAEGYQEMVALFKIQTTWSMDL